MHNMLNKCDPKLNQKGLPRGPEAGDPPEKGLPRGPEAGDPTAARCTVTKSRSPVEGRVAYQQVPRLATRLLRAAT